MGMFDGIGSIVSSAIGYLGQSETNDININQAQANRDYNAGEAEKARGFNAEQAEQARIWQTGMASTNYQRTVADLKDAGLNPMLAYSNGASAVPNGASASGPAASSNAMPQIGNKALAAVQAGQAAQTMENMRKTGENIDANTALTEAQAATERNKPENIVADTHLKTTSAQQTAALTEKVKPEIENIMAQIENTKMRTEHEGVKIALTQAQADLAEITGKLQKNTMTLQDAQKALMATQANLNDRTASLTETKTKLGNLEIPKAENEANAEQSTFRQTVKPIIDNIKGALGIIDNIPRQQTFNRSTTVNNNYRR